MIGAGGPVRRISCVPPESSRSVAPNGPHLDDRTCDRHWNCMRILPDEMSLRRHLVRSGLPRCACEVGSKSLASTLSFSGGDPFTSVAGGSFFRSLRLFLGCAQIREKAGVSAPFMVG